MPRLLLLMTPGVGLSTWISNGTFDREILPYKEYVRNGWKVTIATFEDRTHVPQLPEGIDIIHCWHRWLLGMAPVFLKRAAYVADLLKTNQSWRSWWYVYLALHSKRPILLRCGFVMGANLEANRGNTLAVRVYQHKERWAFQHASACQVPTEALRDWLQLRYRVSSERIYVCPNFVDVDLFRPQENITSEDRTVVFVGRLSKVKRLNLLMQACAKAGAAKLTLIGQGEEHEYLQRLASRLNLCVSFMGQRNQRELPHLIQKSQVFALVSESEGHPKALFEAMACRMPCLGVRTPGIAEAIENGRTGIICAPTVDSISGGLGLLFSDLELRRRLGSSARCYVEKEMGFERIMRTEIRLAETLLQRKSTGYTINQMIQGS